MNLATKLNKPMNHITDAELNKAREDFQKRRQNRSNRQSQQHQQTTPRQPIANTMIAGIPPTIVPPTQPQVAFHPAMVPLHPHAMQAITMTPTQAIPAAIHNPQQLQVAASPVQQQQPTVAATPTQLVQQQPGTSQSQN